MELDRRKLKEYHISTELLDLRPYLDIGCKKKNFFLRSRIKKLLTCKFYTCKENNVSFTLNVLCFLSCTRCHIQGGFPTLTKHVSDRPSCSPLSPNFKTYPLALNSVRRNRSTYDSSACTYANDGHFGTWTTTMRTMHWTLHLDPFILMTPQKKKVRGQRLQDRGGVWKR